MFCFNFFHHRDTERSSLICFRVTAKCKPKVVLCASVVKVFSFVIRIFPDTPPFGACMINRS